MSYARYPITGIGGTFPFEVSLIFPLLGFFYILKIIGLTILTSEKILFVLYYFLSGCSMYYLVSVLTRKGSTGRGPSRVIAALFYMFNYFTVLFTPLLTQYIAYSLFPLILGLYVKGLEDTENRFLRSFLFVLALSFLPAAFSNPPFVAMIVIALVLYGVFDLVFVHRFRKTLHFIQFNFLSVVLYLLINMWFLGVWYFYFATKGNMYLSSSILPGYWNPGSTLSETFVLQGSWAWNDQYFCYFYNYFEKTLFKVLPYIFTIIAFSFVFLRRKSVRVWFFVFLAFIGIFFAKGRWGLFGSFYAWLFDNLPMFWIFREPHTKFTLLTVISFSILLGITLPSICRLIIDRYKKMSLFLVISMYGLIIAVIGFNSWPAFSGDVIPGKRGDIPSFHVKVPDYWKDAQEWVNNNNDDFRLFELPENKWASVWLSWKHGFAAGGDPVKFLFNKPAVQVPATNAVAKQIYDSLDKNEMSKLYKLLHMLDVGYILQRNDFMWKVLETDPPKAVGRMLKRQENIEFDRSFGRLDLYKIKGKSSMFTAATRLIGVHGGPEALGPMTYFYPLDKEALAFFNLGDIKADSEYLKRVSDIVVYNDSYQNFALSIVEECIRIDPERNISWGATDPGKDWVVIDKTKKIQLDPVLMKRIDENFLTGDACVYTLSEKPLRIPLNIDSKETYHLFVRGTVFDKDSTLSIYVDFAHVTDVSLEQDGLNDFQWFYTGAIDLSDGMHEIHIKTGGDRVLIDEIILMPYIGLGISDKKIRNVVRDNKTGINYLLNLNEGSPEKVPIDVISDGKYLIEAYLSPAKGSADKLTVSLNDMDVVLNKTGKNTYEGNIDLKAGKYLFVSGLNNAFVNISYISKEKRDGGRKVEYEKYGSSRYLVKVDRPEEPFYLIFKTPYDNNWELYEVLGGDPGFKLKNFDLFSFFRGRSRLSRIRDQMLVNGFA
ncbi:DUF6541 family protein, partial [Candidatus Auribacterota bacterium]